MSEWSGSSYQSQLPPSCPSGWNDPPPLTATFTPSRLSGRHKRVVDPSITGVGGYSSPVNHCSSNKYAQPQPQGYGNHHGFGGAHHQSLQNYSTPQEYGQQQITNTLGQTSGQYTSAGPFQEYPTQMTAIPQPNGLATSQNTPAYGQPGAHYGHAPQH